MSNQQERGRIWKAVKPVIPENGSPQLEACIRSLDALPGLKTWIPPKNDMLNLMGVLRWAMPVRAVGAIPSFNPLLTSVLTQKFADKIELWFRGFRQGF